MKRAPQVLVVARYCSADDAGRVARCLSRQTYRNTQLVFVQRTARNDAPAIDDSLQVCTEAGLIAWVKKPGVDRILFWPEEVDLKEAAIEKLVLALETAPGQEGVADAAQGSTGLWLTRNHESMISLVALWMGSPLKWIEACEHLKPGLFYIPENLINTPDLSTLRRPYAVEHFFGKLPIQSESYKSIAVDHLWDLPAVEVDARSVLFLVTSLPMGGACKFILDIAGQLKARGYRVAVATTTHETRNPNPWLDELLRIVPDVFVLSHFRPAEVPRAIAHLARSRQCGRIIVSHSMPGYQLLPWLRTELPEVSFLDYTHIEYETEWPNGGYALRSVNNQSMLDMSMVSSEHLREWMSDHGADGSGLRVCHTNIDTDKWAPDAAMRARVRYELGIDAKTTMILYPGRLVEQKRPELMCNIVAALRRDTSAPFIVVVAGDGPHMSALKTFVNKQGLEDSFQILGAVPLERVAQLHNASDVYLLPSLIEGIALALYEAMALESVAVVSDVGGQRELLTPECGYLVPVGEARNEITSYVTALKQLIENPEQRKKMAGNCRKRVQEHFPLSQMTTTFIAAMDEAGLRHENRIVWLPDASVCREIATLAMEHVRVACERSLMHERGSLLQDRMIRQEKIIQKLQKQLQTARSAQEVPEANELLY